MIEQIVYLLQSWQRLTRSIEEMLIDNVSATVHWIAPLPAAYMMYHGMQNELKYPVWIAIGGAVVVEALGLSAISTSFALWDYNDTKRQNDQSAPLRIAIVTAAYYLLIVLVVNVLLDVSPAVHKIAKALLSTLSITAAVILALRSQHSRRLAAIEFERAERKVERQKRYERESSDVKPEVDKASFPKSITVQRPADWRNLSVTERERIKNLRNYEIVQQFGVSDRTARNWRKFVANNGNGKHSQ